MNQYETAERAIIGTLMIDKNYIEAIINMVEPYMFKDQLMAQFYIAFRNAYSEKKEIDIANLIDIAMRNDYPDFVANNLVADLRNRTIGFGELKADARLLMERDFQEKLNEVPNRVDPNAPAYVQYEQYCKNLEAIKPPVENKANTIAEISEQFEEDGSESSDPGVPIGFASIDAKLGGMEKGDLTIIAARPSVGKSAFATQIAVYLSKEGKKVLFINLEMKEKQIYQRLLSMESGVSLNKIRNRNTFMTIDEIDRIRKAKLIIKQYENLSVISKSLKISEIRIMCEVEKPDVVIVDYLQLIIPEGKYRGNRYAEVGEISHSLKAIAMDLNIPVLVLSQLNRVSAAKGKDVQEPTMSELRESGDIEQDASQIILMWNKDDTRRNKALKIEKNRQGEVGTFDLIFDGKKMKFMEEESEENSWNYDINNETPFT